MVKKIDFVYRKGVGKENEDQYLMREDRIFAVIDGATALKPFSFSGSMASKCVQNTLMKLNIEMNVLEMMKSANEQVGKSVYQYSKKYVEELKPEERSTCGCALVKLNYTNQEHSVMQYAHVGDCMVFLLYSNGQIRKITYDHIDKLDIGAIKSSLNYKKEFFSKHKNNNMNSEEIIQLNRIAREHINDLLIKNRRELNTHKGYGIIDGSEHTTRFIESGVIPIMDAEQILILSDGLQLPNSLDEERDNWMETAEYAFQNGLKDLESEVIRREKEDPNCTKYPRLKSADDKTGICIQL
ncbi:protein phosphatase 2C family protein [Bacillus sp. H-16]|uniref:PP2C family serine/threonine-protein phosphatase n=1 Tax=Alteribacter salitolerans TaxID=2912333 RepID=UPI001962DBFE|nr:PP2C family serine/threonine-protein phosphatase [Alteribacter salitolerans]MBM7097552.1 protein phosphatase 2C family protein [Alteribacter salitolerans]